MDYRFGYVTFLSDYGLRDEFVGICHGTIYRIAPEVKIIDITHGIRPQEIREGAMVLAQSVGWMPEAVHLAVVDPTVGSGRLAVALETAEGSCLIGPDNGLLGLAAGRLGGAVVARKIENPDLLLPEPSKTFQGRDVFAPAAAYVARGVPLEEFGEEVPVDSLVKLSLPDPWLHDDHYHAVVLHIDQFGNLQLNLTAKELRKIGLASGSLLEVRLEGHRRLVPYGETFAAVAEKEAVVTEDSYRLLALAINRGDAAQEFGASAGSSVIVGPPGSGAAD